MFGFPTSLFFCGRCDGSSSLAAVAHLCSAKDDRTNFLRDESFNRKVSLAVNSHPPSGSSMATTTPFFSEDQIIPSFCRFGNFFLCNHRFSSSFMEEPPPEEREEKKCAVAAGRASSRRERKKGANVRRRWDGMMMTTPSSFEEMMATWGGRKTMMTSSSMPRFAVHFVWRLFRHPPL